MPNPAHTKLVIEAGHTEQNYWRDLWRYRELFYFLAWRDILVRYKQTAIGVAWSLLRPLITMAVFTIVFGRIAGMPSDGVPYPLLVFCGMLPWQFVANAFSESGGSLIANSNLISKIYFPRLIIPSGAVVVGFVDFLISAGFLLILMAWYRFAPDWRVLFLPCFVLLATASSLGAGFLVAALTVQFRDFRYIIPFCVQFGMYISPVGFSSSVVSPRWLPWYSLNPLVGIIDGFRWALLHGQEPFHGLSLTLAVVNTTLLLVLGIWYFRKTERLFADVI